MDTHTHTWDLAESKHFQLKIMPKWFQLKSLHKWLTLNPWAIFPNDVLRADAIKEGLSSPHPFKDAEAEWTKHWHNCQGRCGENCFFSGWPFLTEIHSGRVLSPGLVWIFKRHLLFLPVFKPIPPSMSLRKKKATWLSWQNDVNYEQ